MKRVLFIIAVYSLLLNIASAQSVDLLWQGETYTPPFYKGKALWSNQSKITFLAIPHGVGNATNVTYKWTKNGTVLGNSSGVGKNTISFTDTVLSKPQTIQIDILSAEKDLLASASVTVSPISPTLAVYENNPLYGFMFHKEALGAFDLQENEITFTGFPMFFSVIGRTDSLLSYKWRTNTGETGDKNSATYRIPDEASGSSEIRVEVSNTDKIMQSANTNFAVKFGNQ